MINPILNEIAVELGHVNPDALKKLVMFIRSDSVIDTDYEPKVKVKRQKKTK